MINPNDVNLIIFDLDGTIVMSQPLVYEGVKRAFKKLGWPVTFKIEEINQFIGNPTSTVKGTLYDFINPPDSPYSADEMREIVRAEYPAIFRDMAVSFPGVKETLATLRKRGYKLAQYTNSSTAYLNTVMSSLNIRDYYDFVECIQDNNLTKDLLVKKIRKHFGGMTAAVVGDRHHDIESARVNNSLSIGALYGYGGKEPEEADLTISQFSDLLTIFDRRLPIFEKILNEAAKKKRKDKAFIIGINGIDCSGKTTFAKDLEAYLKARGKHTQLVHIDDFLNPKAIRYAGNDQADKYYTKSFNFELLIDKLLKPISQKGKISTKLTALNLETDKFDTTRNYDIKTDSIVILEGVFLFRKELAPYIDYKVYLDISFEECKHRAALRDSTAIAAKYDDKYLPAEQRYIREYAPEKSADLATDNNNAEYPKILRQRLA